MLEILMLNQLVRFISRILRAKQRSPGWFQLLAVLLWFGGEIVAGTIGVLLGLEMPGAYALALLGAAAGAAGSYVIARRAAPGAPESPEVARVFE
jgi:hypothetical protein